MCIDLNTILHQVTIKSNTESQFKNNLYYELNNLNKKITPKFLAIFIDGQAVLAKVKTQIKRRRKYLYQECNNLSSLCLTPGTVFMDLVDDIINEYLQNLNIETYYSDSKENNEGEIKLFNWLIKNKFYNNICIVGNDADIIVLALSNIPLLHVYIYNNKEFISLFRLIDSMAKISNKTFDYKYHPIRQDFVLLSLLQGNDYNNSLASFNNVLNSYTKLLKNNKFLISKDGNINLNNFKLLLQNMKRNNEIIYPKLNVNNYFNSLLWNLKLYKGFTIPNYIPVYKINISTILNYYPKKNNFPIIDIKWQHPDTYLLLLLPLTGKKYLPNRLKKYMEDESPIKDLFPEPCKECIKFKSKINEFKDSEDTAIIGQINEEYKKHLNNFHNFDDLPIERINAALSVI